MTIIIKDKVNDKLFINHSKVVQVSYKGKNFTNKDIAGYVERLKQKYKGKNLMMMVSVDTPYGFRSGKAFNINDKTVLVEDYDFDEFPTFVVYVWKANETAGGNDEFNDCLFKSITKVIQVFRLPKDYKRPEDLKNYLGLKRNDKIDIKYIHLIEELYKLNINISGDYSYTSPAVYSMTVNLILYDGHYELLEEVSGCKTLLKGIPKLKQNLILCDEKPDSVICYDGKKITELDYENYFTEKYNNKENSYITEYDKNKGIVESYNQLISEVEYLKELTNGKIDLSRSGFKISYEALKTLHYSFKPFDEPDEITRQEQIWIYNATKGALIFSNPCELENGFCYDKRSCYPSVLCDDKFTFPIKEGIFHKFNELPNILNYGIYRIEILQSGNEDLDKFFRFNKLNYYTHYDVQTAKELGLKINLVINDEANALLYTTKRANSGKYFKQSIYSLYALKSKSKLPKQIINAMWGALCEKKKIKRTTTKAVNLNNNEKILDIRPCGNELKITYVKDSNFYKHNYARLAPFLLSKVRRDMAVLFVPYKENIVRFHTDGAISKIRLPLDIGEELGQWKLEKEGEVKITNSNKIEWV